MSAPNVVVGAEGTKKKTQYAGADWLRENLGKDAAPPSPLGACVANILGHVYRGLYHLPNRSIDRAEWHNASVVIVTVGHELATIDAPELLEVVVLAQACGVRLAIKGAAPGYMRLQFTAGDFMWFGKVAPPHEAVDRVLNAADYVIAANTVPAAVGAA